MLQTYEQQKKHHITHHYDLSRIYDHSKNTYTPRFGYTHKVQEKPCLENEFMARFVENNQDKYIQQIYNIFDQYADNTQESYFSFFEPQVTQKALSYISNSNLNKKEKNEIIEHIQIYGLIETQKKFLHKSHKFHIVLHKLIDEIYTPLIIQEAEKLLTTSNNGHPMIDNILSKLKVHLRINKNPDMRYKLNKLKQT